MEDICNRQGKALSASRSMNVWRPGQYSTNTKLKLYKSCIISTLLYGSQCWRMTEADLAKLCSFHTTCLRRILWIFWPEKISDENLLRRCRQENMGTIITRRRWRWIEHVLLRKEPQSITRTALHFTRPQMERGREEDREQLGGERSRMRWRSCNTLWDHLRDWPRVGRGGETFLLP